MAQQYSMILKKIVSNINEIKIKTKRQRLSETIEGKQNNHMLYTRYIHFKEKKRKWMEGKRYSMQTVAILIKDKIYFKTKLLPEIGMDIIKG